MNNLRRLRSVLRVAEVRYPATTIPAKSKSELFLLAQQAIAECHAQRRWLRFHAAETRAGYGRSVIRVFARNEHIPLWLVEKFPVSADHANHGVNRFGTRPGKKGAVELRLGHALQDMCELN